MDLYNKRKKKSLRKCIDCAVLDFGFTENDSFPHCAIRHSREIALGISAMQREITKTEAYQERVCDDFTYTKKEVPEFVFNIDTESMEYQQYFNEAGQFLNILEEDAKNAGIKLEKGKSKKII